MNATSSRAHTVVTITFDQIAKNEAGQETKKSSSINLVDLAGKNAEETKMINLGLSDFYSEYHEYFAYIYLLKFTKKKLT